MLRARGWYAEALAARRRGQPARCPRRDPRRPAAARRAPRRAGRHRRPRARGRAPHRAGRARAAHRAAFGASARRAGVGRARPGDRAAHAALGPPAGRPGDRGGARRPARDRPGDQRAARRRPGRGGRAAAGPADGPGAAHPRTSLHRGAAARTPWRRPPPSTNWPRGSATPGCWSSSTPTARSSRSRWPRAGSGCTGSARCGAPTTCSTASRSPSPGCCGPTCPPRCTTRPPPCCATAPPGRTTRCCAGCPSSPAGRWSSCRPGRCRTCRGRSCPPARGGRSRSPRPRRCGSAPASGPPSPATPWSPPARRCRAPTPRRGPSRQCTASTPCWPPTRRPSGCCERSTAPPSSTWPRTAASPRTTRCSPSSLLADGPLFAYDIEQLATAPHTVVLAACESGRSVVCAGDELLGLGAMFLARGSSQLVASPLPVPDTETAPLMTAFHRRRRGGAAGGAGAGGSAGADARDRRGGADDRQLRLRGSGFGRAPLLPAPQCRGVADRATLSGPRPVERSRHRGTPAADARTTAPHRPPPR